MGRNPPKGQELTTGVVLTTGYGEQELTTGAGANHRAGADHHRDKMLTMRKRN